MKKKNCIHKLKMIPTVRVKTYLDTETHELVKEIRERFDKFLCSKCHCEFQKVIWGEDLASRIPALRVTTPAVESGRQ
jgi:hypothetical protein